MATEAGHSVPEAIANAPEIYDGEHLFYNGFMELDTCRPIGLAKGQIPWTAIDQYCRSMGFDDDLALEFHDVIRQIDIEMLNYEAAEAERKRQGKTNGKRS